MKLFGKAEKGMIMQDINKPVTEQMLQKFLEDEKNKRMLAVLDFWFSQQVQKGDVEPFLCFIKCMHIFLQLAGQKIGELEVILNDKKCEKSYISDMSLLLIFSSLKTHNKDRLWTVYYT